MGLFGFLELLRYRVFPKGYLVIEGDFGVENASGGFFEDLSMGCNSVARHTVSM